MAAIRLKKLCTDLEGVDDMRAHVGEYELQKFSSISLRKKYV